MTSHHALGNGQRTEPVPGPTPGGDQLTVRAAEFGREPRGNAEPAFGGVAPGEREPRRVSRRPVSGRRARSVPRSAERIHGR